MNITDDPIGTLYLSRNSTVLWLKHKGEFSSGRKWSLLEDIASDRCQYVYSDTGRANEIENKDLPLDVMSRYTECPY